MGFLNYLAGVGNVSTPHADAGEATLSTAPVELEPVAVAEPPSPHSIEGMTNRRAERVAVEIARSIPSVRKAEGIIAGTVSTFELGAYDAAGVRRESQDVAWLAQPEPSRTRSWLIRRTVSDLIWHDRAVWRIVDRSSWGVPTRFERLHPHRVDVVPDPIDPDRVASWIVDGRETDESRLVIFDGAGIGGLHRYGYDLLTIYGQLQAAAGRYARAPQPYAILKNRGADLDDDAINDLLNSWDAARERRAVGYLNEVVDYETITGYSARDLQLVEAREHAALEVARLFALPAFALDASQPGSSLTYGNVVERRRDLLESLRPWMAVIEDTLSLDDRTSGRTSGRYLPRGVFARFDANAYTRDAPKDRMEVWNLALEKGVLDLDEVRAAEPLTRK